jgi:hypothetical protein
VAATPAVTERGLTGFEESPQATITRLSATAAAAAGTTLPNFMFSSCDRWIQNTAIESNDRRGAGSNTTASECAQTAVLQHFAVVSVVPTAALAGRQLVSWRADKKLTIAGLKQTV